MRIEVETHPLNPNGITIHTDFRLPEDSLGRSDFAQILRSIDGVARAWSRRYWVHIVKGRLFEWRTIEPQVRAALESYAAETAAVDLELKRIETLS